MRESRKQKGTEAEILGSETEIRRQDPTVLVLEYIRAHDTHEIGERYADGGEYDPAAFMGYIVVVPHV